MPTVKKRNDGRAGIERLLRENPPSSDPCHEGQENAALVPRVYGQYEKHSIFDLVHCTAAKMYGVLPKPAVDNRMIDKITYGDGQGKMQTSLSEVYSPTDWETFYQI